MGNLALNCETCNYSFACSMFIP